MSAETLAVLYGILQPFLLIVFSALVTTALGWLTAWAQRKLKLDVEARHREALHQALMTGVEYGLGKLFGQGTPGSVSLGEAQRVAAAAANYAQDSVPDAIRVLNPSPGLLERIATAKLQSILARPR